MPRRGRLDAMRAQTAAMVDHLAVLVSVETPSEDLACCAAGATAVSELATALIQEPGERLEVGGRPHLRWTWPAGKAGPGVVLIGHYDTVWPRGTLARWPFSVDEPAGTATGPGCFDMKAGIVQLFHKGIGVYRLEVHGRAAHAGLEPENGANALIELCHLLLAVSAVTRPGSGTSVTPAVAGAGTARNVVPALAYAELDVRAALPHEAVRIDRELRALQTTVPGTTLTVTGGLNRPPMPRSSSAALHILASTLAASLGLGPLDGASAGGGSDGNFTAAVGCPTLDGLGAVGGNAHAEGEHVTIAAMPERAALLAELLDHLRAGS
jgi:glutamate carboxypeptidase